ncbi:MAG TPA: TatD family hydrolase [Geothrix sp.]|nr:TatD family hydrolase [Geothrix sp.]
MPAVFDAHSHLTNASAQPPDHPIVVCGTCETDWPIILDHAASNPNMIPMLGQHPSRTAAPSPDWAARLEALLRAHRAGVGECGLDFARKDTDRSLQVAAFRQQLRLAHALRRPVAMHCVQAWGLLLELLREEGVPPAGAMVHAYSGSLETARILGKQGVFASVSGDILKPGRTHLRQVVAGLDPDHLLVESDGQADLQQVIAGMAEIRGTQPDALAALTWENGQRCFKELLP